MNETEGVSRAERYRACCPLDEDEAAAAAAAAVAGALSELDDMNSSHRLFSGEVVSSGATFVQAMSRQKFAWSWIFASGNDSRQIGHVAHVVHVAPPPGQGGTEPRPISSSPWLMISSPQMTGTLRAGPN